MRPIRAPLPLCCILTGLLLLPACREGTGNNRDAAQPAADPPAPALEGLSPEQIQQRAQAISPEQAEELGVVDTTVQVTDEP